MTKRFCDTELWQKEWFQNLTIKEKVLIKYIFENCDCAGVWNANFKMASFIIGEKVNKEDIEKINNQKIQFEELEDGSVFIKDFVKFQYGELSDKCKPHLKVINTLKKYNLFERVTKGYAKSTYTLEEKEKEDIYMNPLKSYFVDEYKKTFKNTPFLTSFECKKLEELTAEIPDIKQHIPTALEKLKQINFPDINFKPSASWLLRENNFAKVLNGEFDKQESEEEKYWRERKENKGAKNG